MLVDQTYLSTQVYLMVAALYLAMSLPLAYALRKLALDTTDAFVPRGSVATSYHRFENPCGSRRHSHLDRLRIR